MKIIKHLRVHLVLLCKDNTFSNIYFFIREILWKFNKDKKQINMSH